MVQMRTWLTVAECIRLFLPAGDLTDAELAEAFEILD